MQAPEHIVRLNAAWEVSAPDDPSVRPFRVDLPVDWSGLSWPGGWSPRRIRLSRRFGRPAGLDPAAPEARARLVVDGGAAVRVVEINGRPTSWSWAGPDRLIVELPELGTRNTAEFMIEPHAAVGAWGGVALVFGGEPAAG